MSVTLITGCATVIHGTKQKISVGSSPDGAPVFIDDQEQGVTPLVVALSRGQGHAIRIEKPGHDAYQGVISKGLSAWVLGNIVFGGPIGLVIGAVIDAGSGGLYTLSPPKVEAVLAKQPAERSR